MNANGLARLYDRLTVWERIPLLLAANARDDATEHRRLSDTAPLRTWRFPEHLLAEQALHTLALIYVGAQLDAAARYFFALWQLGDDAPGAEEWLHAAEACAYFFAANADAWRRLCAELDIEADALTAANHPGWFLRYCGAHMPANAPTAEALQARFRASGRDASQLVTADSLLASWQNRLHSMTGHAPRPARKGEG
jgi:hypothetical protein